MGNFLPRHVLDSSFLWGYVHFPSWNYVFPLTHDFCWLPFHVVCILWAGKETFKRLEAAAGCKVTGAGNGLGQAQSCKSVKCIAHNFLVPALLGSRALLGWMSSQHENSWIWCFFCLQGNGAHLRQEWYVLPRGHQPPDFSVAFPSCSLKDLVLHPTECPVIYFRGTEQVGTLSCSAALLNGQIQGERIFEWLRVLCFSVSTAYWRLSSFFHLGTWKRFLFL